jgi:hypothetical protein
VLGEEWGGTASTQGDTPTSSASEVKKNRTINFFMKPSAPIEHHENRCLEVFVFNRNLK